MFFLERSPFKSARLLSAYALSKHALRAHALRVHALKSARPKSARPKSARPKSARPKSARLKERTALRSHAFQIARLSDHTPSTAFFLKLSSCTQSNKNQFQSLVIFFKK